MMKDLFIQYLNLSIKGSWIILAVIFLRFVLRDLPKKYRIGLWGIAALRLMIPFSFHSVFSLIPHAQPIPSDITIMEKPVIHSGFERVDQAVNPVISETFAPSAGSTVSPLQTISLIASWIWLAGIILMLGYMILSALKLKRKLARLKPDEGGIVSDVSIPSPFVFGFIHPVVYLPEGINEAQRSCILLHEKMHIARKDTWTKLIGYLCLSVHWFNPLVWLAWHLLCTDIELACDEAVLEKLDEAAQKRYARTVLECSSHPDRFALTPLAFSETDVKKRIRNMVKFRKPTLAVTISAALICFASACAFLNDPQSTVSDPEDDSAAPVSEPETLLMNVASHTAGIEDQVHISEDEYLISEFNSLYDSLAGEKGSDEDIIVQKYGFESIPDLYLESDTRRIYLLRQDFSKETDNSRMDDAYYAELYENGKEKKLLIVSYSADAGRRIERLIKNMKEVPSQASMTLDDAAPIFTAYTLIATAQENIYCLKEELFIPQENYALVSYENDEADQVLNAYAYSVSLPGDVWPSDSFVNSLDYMVLSTSMQRSLEMVRWIELDSSKKAELVSRLRNCNAAMTLRNTATDRVFSRTMPVSVMETEDLSYDTAKIPYLKNLVKDAYFLVPDQSEPQTGIRFTPYMNNTELLFTMDYMENGEKKASSTLRMIPTDGEVWNRLSPVFLASVSREPLLFDDGEMHWQFDSGLYAVAMENDAMVFYATDSDGHIIQDSGIRISVLN